MALQSLDVASDVPLLRLLPVGVELVQLVLALLVCQVGGKVLSVLVFCIRLDGHEMAVE